MDEFTADASAHMPLGVFLGDELLAVVPSAVDPYGYATVERLAAERQIPPRGFEVLALCHLHPRIAAVDCLDCGPI